MDRQEAETEEELPNPTPQSEDNPTPASHSSNAAPRDDDWEICAALNNALDHVTPQVCRTEFGPAKKQDCIAERGGQPGEQSSNHALRRHAGDEQNAVVYGKLVWESRMDMERAGYVMVKTKEEGGDFVNPHLVRCARQQLALM